MSSTTSKRRPSLPSSSSESVLRGVDQPKAPPMALFKHGKYVLAGVTGCWWTDVLEEVGRILDTSGGWIRKTLVAALAFHALTVAIFLYLVLFLPWLRGYIPNYPQWQKSRRLRVLVPLLSIAILFGWSCYVVALSQGGSSPLEALGNVVHAVGDADASKFADGGAMGLLKAMMAATGLYATTLGLLGFIPAPSGVPVRRKEQ